ncbi:MAG TPA: acyl-CoA dehydrogenase family protein [Candidatus Binatia bacterium]|jgi:acyl-CoA dehydrogenase
MLPYFDSEHLPLQERARSWAEKIFSHERGEDPDVEKASRRIVEELGRAGWLGYAVPKSFGGARDKIQVRDVCLLREELAYASALADTMFAVQALGSYPITLAGTDEQKSRRLPPMARGEIIAAFALTEPEAGSDVASISTRAVKRGREYSLSGVKSFVSNAGIAHSYVVFASTDPENRGKGLSAFIVDGDSRGFTIKEKLRLLSPHPIGVIALENCVVPESNLLGREGDGIKIAFATLDTLRCTVGAAAVGLARRALDEALRYSQKRQQFGQKLGQFQGIQFKLADMATELEAARLLVYQAAWAHDRGEADVKKGASMAKLFATEAAQRIVDQALQIHGGIGVVADTPVARLYNDVRSLRIYEGTSEIQKLVIARSLLNSSGVKREG